MGKGFAALGNFTCPDCRLALVMEDASKATAQTRDLVTKTMILELGQGTLRLGMQATVAARPILIASARQH